jgi:hypothetical protein
MGAISAQIADRALTLWLKICQKPARFPKHGLKVEAEMRNRRGMPIFALLGRHRHCRSQPITRACLMGFP